MKTIKELEQLSKENLIDELMIDSIKGGCCGWTDRTTGGTNTTDSKRDGPGQMLVAFE